MRKLKSKSKGKSNKDLTIPKPIISAKENNIKINNPINQGLSIKTRTRGKI